MKKLVVDSSIFVSMFLEDEEDFGTSREFLSKLQTKQITIFISIVTLFEVLHSHYRNTKDPKATEKVQQFFINLNVSKRLKIMNLEADFLSHFAVHHQKFDLKTSDALIALTALKENCPLISWDKQLLKAAKKQVEAYTPKEYLKRN